MCKNEYGSPARSEAPKAETDILRLLLTTDLERGIAPDIDGLLDLGRRHLSLDVDAEALGQIMPSFYRLATGVSGRTNEDLLEELRDMIQATTLSEFYN